MFTLKSLKTLIEKIPDLSYVIIGDGEKKTGLMEWIRRNDLTANVILTGHLERRDCLYLMSKADVLVLTSESEALPIVLIEAQALGIPVVAFDVGGVGDIIQDGRNGYVIEKDNTSLFVERISAILSNERLRSLLGQCGRKNVQADFTIEMRIKKLLSMIVDDLEYLKRLKC